MSRTLLILLCLVFLTSFTYADEKATKLVSGADLKLRGKISSFHDAQFIVFRPGKKIERRMLAYLKGKKYSFTHFIEPVRDKGTTLLKRNYDLWMYTPKVRKVVRIPFGMMHQGVLGSDFTYDDIVKEATLTDDYNHKIVGISKGMSKKYKRKVYVIDMFPKPGRPVAYKKLRAWISPKGFCFYRLQYYNDKLKVTRILKYSKFAKVDDRVIPTVWTMYNLLKKGYKTVYILKKGVYNKMKSDAMFVRRSLKNPPK